MVRLLQFFIFGFLLGGLYFSCEEPIEIGDLPEVKPKLVVISNFLEGKAIEVTVSSSQQLGDNGPDHFLTNAKVDLYWKNNFLEQLKLVIPKDPNRSPYYRTFENIAVAGREYTIKVSADGYQEVMAKSFIPPSIKITKFYLKQLLSEEMENGEILRDNFSAIVDFDDPADEVNYYHLNITQQINNFMLEGQDTLVTKSFLQPVVFDPFYNQNSIIAHFNGGLLFEDKPGKKELNISFSVDINPTRQLLGKTYVELRTLSKDYYLYFTSLSRAEGGSNSPNPIYDPVIIYQNVENGHGIFAGYSNSLDSVQIVQ